MSNEAFAECPNLVAWALSSTHPQDQPVLIDAINPKRVVTREKAHMLVAAFVGAFEDDSTVCLHISNDITYPILVLGILVNDCRWTGTNVTYTVTELEHHFRVSNTKYVVTAEEHFETVRMAVEVSGTRAEIIRFEDLLQDEVLQKAADNRADSFISAEQDEKKGEHIRHNSNEEGSPDAFSQLRSLRDLLGDPTDVDLIAVVKNIRPTSIAALMQTSGTTGLPKMAARTHHALVIESQAIVDNDACKPYEIRRLFCTPAFHGFTFPLFVFNTLKYSGTNYVMKRYDNSFAQKIYDFQITETMGAPPMLRMLVKDPNARPLLQSLRMISFGGAVLGPELRRMTLDMFEIEPRLVPVYGMTEGGWFTTLKYPEVDDTGSVGRPIPGYEIKVNSIEGLADNDGNHVMGEILVRAPQLMTKYLGNEKATENAFKDGWLKTGDIGYLTDGKVYLVDRAKELIKVNGWQVAPAELEDVLMQSEHVQDVAVFGVGEEEEEHPMVCVVARDGTVTEETVMAHLSTRLARYKTSRCEVLFVHAIPKSPAGKILKKIMKEQLAAGTLI